MIGLREIALEVEDVAQVGAAPLVDRLVRVADDGQVAVHAGELLDQQVLRPVGVLILVHHDELELAGIALAHGGAWSNSSTVFSSRSSKSSALASLQRSLVAGVEPRRFRGRCGFQLFSKVSGPSMRFLAWLMRLEHRARLIGVVVEAVLLDQLLDHRLLVGRVVDDEVARQADAGRLAPQQARAQRVERRDPHRPAVGAEQRLDARAHLLRRLVGEGDREHAVGTAPVSATR